MEGWETQSQGEIENPYEHERMLLLKELKHVIISMVEMYCSQPIHNRRPLHGDMEIVQLLLVWLNRCLWHGLREQLDLPRGKIDEKFVVRRDTRVSLWMVVQHLLNAGIVSERNADENVIVEIILQVQALNASDIVSSKTLVVECLNQQAFPQLLTVLTTSLSNVLPVYFFDHALIRFDSSFCILQTLTVSLSGLDFDIASVDACTSDIPPTGIRRFNSGKSLPTSIPWIGLTQSLTSPVRASSNNSDPRYQIHIRANKKRAELAKQQKYYETQLPFYGTPLLELARSRKWCVSAYWCTPLAIPDVILRCVALIWDSLGSTTTVNKFGKLHNSSQKIMEIRKELEKMGGDGLTIFNRVGVDTTVDNALSAIATNTKAAAGSQLDVLNDVFMLMQFLIQFCMQLPEPLIIEEVALPLVYCLQIQNDSDRIRNIILLVERIPRTNIRIFDLVIRLLDKFSRENTKLREAVGGDLAISMFGNSRNKSTNAKAFTNRNMIQIILEVAAGHEEVFQNHRNEIYRISDQLAKKDAMLRDACVGLNRIVHTGKTEEQEENGIALQVVWSVLGKRLVEEEDGMIVERPVPGPSKMSLVSSGWLERGSTDIDVTMDLQPGGVTSLRDLSYFCLHHGKTAQQILFSQRYPFIQIASQVSKMNSDMLGISVYNLKGSDDKEIARNPWWKLLDEEDSLHRLFCLTFLIFDTNLGQNDLMSVPKILQQTKVQVLDLLSLEPDSINSLWHSWILQRAEEKVHSKSSRRLSRESSDSTRSRSSSLKSPREGLSPSAASPRASWSSEAMPNGAHTHVLPTLSETSLLISDKHLIQLEAALPVSYHGYDWKLCFATNKHGFRFEKLMEAAGSQNAGILLIRDAGGFVFGAFTCGAWTVTESFAGTSDSFLFSLEPEFKVFRWTQRNQSFMLISDDSVAFGGGGGQCGIYFDADLKTGSSGTCDTYDNPQLSSTEDFDIDVVEFWSFSIAKSSS